MAATHPTPPLILLIRALLALTLALGLVGCAFSRSSPPPGPTPATQPTAVVFPDLGGAETGASDVIDDLAVRGKTMVAVGVVADGRIRATFRYSADRGRSWVSGHVENGMVGSFADRARYVVARPGGGWLAIGSTLDDEAVTWTSGDGVSWQREVPKGDLRPGSDEWETLVATPQGFLLAGQRRRADGGTRAVVWRSTDGRTWRRHPLPGPGTVEVSDAAVGNGRTVVVGTSDGRARVWASRNGGRSWRPGRIDLPRAVKDVVGDVELNGVSAWGGGFRAIGSYALTTWQPLVLASSDGRRWTLTASTPTLSPGHRVTSFGNGLAWADGAGLAGGRAGVRGSVVTLARLDHGRWRQSKPPTNAWADEPDEQYVVALVSSGSVGVVAVRGVHGNSDAGALWRTTDRGRTYRVVELPPAADQQPVQRPLSLATGPDGSTVVGVSRGLPAVWSVDAGGAISAPQRLGTSPRLQAGLVAMGPDGPLIFGSRAGGNPSDAVAWAPSGTGGFLTTAREAFQTSSPYAWSEISDAHWIRDRWYVVGQSGRDGSADPSALVATSSDGVHWRRGDPGSVTRKMDGVPVGDLAGSETHARRMNDVAAVPEGLLAVGSASSGGLDQPAVWRSSEGQRWRLDLMPTRGQTTGQMADVVTRGSTVIAVGSVARGPGDPDAGYVWRSSDGGRSWHGQRLAGRPDRLERIVSTKTAFVITGTQTIDGHRQPRIWKSADGRSWSTVEVPDGPGPDGSRRSLVAASAEGDDLVALLRTTTPDQDQTELIRIPIG